MAIVATLPSRFSFPRCGFAQCGTGIRVKSRLVASAVTGAEADPPCTNPETPEYAVDQARGAIQRAIQDGKKMHRLELLLPVNQRQYNYLDTEPRDYPCGILQEFQACCKMVTAILQGMESSGQAVETRDIGDAGDPVALLYPSSKTIAAIVFPVAETLNQMRTLVKKYPDRPLVLVNPQWNELGPLVSDFGFGHWKRQAEEFLRQFEAIYSLSEKRIGEGSNTAGCTGGIVRLLRCYPFDWHVYLMSWDGTSELIGKFPKQPTYQELENLVKEVRKIKPATGGLIPPPPPVPKHLSGPLTDEEIDGMEAVDLRRALIALNKPSSGKLLKLRQRFKEAQKENNSE